MQFWQNYNEAVEDYCTWWKRWWCQIGDFERADDPHFGAASSIFNSEIIENWSHINLKSSHENQKGCKMICSVIKVVIIKSKAAVSFWSSWIVLNGAIIQLVVVARPFSTAVSCYIHSSLFSPPPPLSTPTLLDAKLHTQCYKYTNKQGQTHKYKHKPWEMFHRFLGKITL